MFAGIINKLTILPRWVIIAIDLLVISISTSLGYMLRFNFDWSDAISYNPAAGIMTSMASWFASTLLTRSYAGIVRYTGVEDGLRLFYTTFLSLLFVCFANLIYYYNVDRNLIPYSVLLIGFPISFFFLFFYRLLVKSIFAYYKSGSISRMNVAIFGAGQLGLTVKNMIESNSSSRMRVVALLEDDPNKVGKQIQGSKIFHSLDLEKVVKQSGIKELIIAVKDLSLERKNQLVDQCLGLHLKVRIVPPVERWVKGELSLKQIKEIKIEDLLGREEIVMEDGELKRDIAGMVVCVTGAAGSIGSELARQLSKFSPARLILIDQAESFLFEIENELIDNKLTGDSSVLSFVADITNEQRIEQIFSNYKPDLVFHAAAYKHVPMMESNPSEAVLCNVIGTKILADLAVKYKVKKFVMISTDKAVNPTSVMGCSKRIAEIYVQALNQHIRLIDSDTGFVTTRFGNVLGSNGSVIPLFKRQIEAGGPITVTHPQITRYFMTIPEACRLVLEAGVMGNGGEIYIFDMGKPIRILDLAKKMVMLSGLENGRDIDIVFTGLRSGEKLFEELLNNSENTIPTHHTKILKAKVSEYPYTQINNFVGLMTDLVTDKNELKLVALMKEIVPEFKSNYSRFEVLDTGAA